jgi:hypothetical protein
MKLAQLQESFQAHVLHATPDIAQHIQRDARISPTLRLAVYAQAYALRLVEVLGETYPAVQAALGARRFAALLAEFARERPSRFRSARAYGEELPGWLGSRLRGPRAGGIADLARFEWAVAGAFDAADQPALAPAGLATVAPEDWARMRFDFSPTLRRLTVTSNCVAFWRCACAEAPRPARWRATCEQHWLVWRRELAVYYRRLSRTEARVLEAAQAGQPFAQLCEQLEDASRAANVLHGWVSEGLVTAVSARG